MIRRSATDILKGEARATFDYCRRRVNDVLLEAMHRSNEARRLKMNDGGRLSVALWGLAAEGNGHLTWSGVELEALGRKYGTPLHVVNEDRLRSNYSAFLNAFAVHYPHVEVSYSYKSNPVPGVLEALHRFGAGAEVISHYELWLALQLGVAPDRIIFNGPAKTPAAVELAVSRGIGLINIDSDAEIDRIARAAQGSGRRQAVGVRVVTSVGWASQFGIPLANGSAFRAFERLASVDSVDPQGIHIHLGTGIRDIGTYRQAIREVLEFAFELKSRLSINLRHLDFGGGFGVPTVQDYTTWDNKLMASGFPAGSIDISDCPPISAYGEMIGALLREHVARDPEFKPRVVFEPGRAITSSAQSLLVSLLHVKLGEGNSRYAVADGGRNVATPLKYEQHEVFPVSRMHDPLTDTPYNVAGPLCHPNDILFRIKRFPELRTGDMLAIMDSGAYFVTNQMNFSNPRPAVVMISDGRDGLLRQAETFDHMIALDRKDLFAEATDS